MTNDNMTTQEVLRMGAESDFWQVMMEGINNMIENLHIDHNSNSKLKDLPADQYKLENEIYLQKVANLKELQQLPNAIIVSMNDSPDDPVNHDPYATAEDLKKE